MTINVGIIIFGIINLTHIELLKTCWLTEHSKNSEIQQILILTISFRQPHFSH